MLGKPSRQLWIAALVVSVACLAGLTYALVTDWNTPKQPIPGAEQRLAEVREGSNFTLGLVIGLGTGIVIGALIALRKRT